MKHIPVVFYDSFAQTPGMGNPCGVVLNADGLTDGEMQAVAAKIGLNETGFVCTSQTADVRFRFFMPARETPLCGHGTVCTLSAYMQSLTPPPAGRQELTAETLAGVLRLGYTAEGGLVEMQQADARFEPFVGDVSAVARAIGLEAEDIDPHLPVLYGSTGSWTLILPVKTREAFGRMQPQNREFARLLAAHPEASVHPICQETIHPDCALHGRHFSGATSGSVEDPVTGTACGVMAAYALLHMGTAADEWQGLIEQGQDMGRDGRVWARAVKEGDAVHVTIAGSAIAGETRLVTID